VPEIRAIGTYTTTSTRVIEIGPFLRDAGVDLQIDELLALAHGLGYKGPFQQEQSLRWILNRIVLTSSVQCTMDITDEHLECLPPGASACCARTAARHWRGALCSQKFATAGQHADRSTTGARRVSASLPGGSQVPSRCWCGMRRVAT
jgi:hypothetical protein